MPCPYSRRPALLFESVCVLHDAPLNEDFERGHSGVQPVRYYDIRLKVDLDDGVLTTGDHIGVADVDWLSGTICTYCDDDDAAANVFACETQFKIGCAGLSSSVYAEEIASYVRRGHSITEPNCTCRHGLSATRALDLGVKSHRTGYCHCVRTTTTAGTIAREIAVEDYMNYVDEMGVCLGPLLDTIQCPSNCRIKSPADLLAQLCKAAPLPLQMPSPSDSYAGIERDSQQLHKNRQIAMLPSMHDGRWSLFHIDDMGMHVDADVKKLWHL